MPEKSNLMEHPVNIGHVLWAAGAVAGVCYTFYLLLHNEVGSLRTEEASNVQLIHTDIKGLIDVVHSDAMDANKQIATVSAQIAVTNTKLDDLIAATKEQKSVREK